MIILLGTDDTLMAASARQHVQDRAPIYGTVVAKIGDAAIPPLDDEEDLYLAGWGKVPAQGTAGNPTVGNKHQGGTRYDAVALWARLVTLGVVPDDWAGRIFLCVSGAHGEHPEMELTFAELFETQAALRAPKGRRVYARTKPIDPEREGWEDSLIPGPGDAVWTNI